MHAIMQLILLKTYVWKLSMWITTLVQRVQRLVYKYTSSSYSLLAYVVFKMYKKGEGSQSLKSFFNASVD